MVDLHGWVWGRAEGKGRDDGGGQGNEGDVEPHGWTWSLCNEGYGVAGVSKMEMWMSERMEVVKKLWSEGEKRGKHAHIYTGKVVPSKTNAALFFE